MIPVISARLGKAKLLDSLCGGGFGGGRYAFVGVRDDAYPCKRNRAARVALGPDLPPFYTEDDALAAELLACAAVENDPLWRMPLWRGYEPMLESKIADIKSTGTGGFAGSITAALFLRKFVAAAKSWAHFDVYAWTPAAKPGRPEGGECQAARALYALLASRYDH